MSEDDKFRYGNHYHNPLQDWNVSGYKGFDTTGSGFLDLLIRKICDSAPVWAQRVDQSASLTNIVSKANRSWPNARQYFYDALTAIDEDTRNTNFINCFTSVGQVMHLLEDMSVPAHVRDDSHAKGNIYEIWVNYELTKNPDPTPFEDKYLNCVNCHNYAPDPSLFKKGFDKAGKATIPIAGLFDADVYNNPNPDPNLTTGAAGLSEYTNANFLSEDSIFSQFSWLSFTDAFPYPAISSTEFRKVSNQGFAGDREYFVKIKDGENSYGPTPHDGGGYLLATHGFLDTFATAKMDQLVNYDTPGFTKWLQADILMREARMTVSPGLDDNCYTDYATKLLPRAVGYSKALLQYFFRGQIEAVDPYAVTDKDGNTTGVKLRVRNKTPGAAPGTREPIGGGNNNGSLTVSYQYKSGSTTVYGKSDSPSFENYSGHTYRFTSFTPPIPQGTKDPQFLLVYRGKLGAEDDAVAANNFSPGIVIDDWESGQNWTTADPLVTLSYNTATPYEGSGALRIDTPGGSSICSINNLGGTSIDARLEAELIPSGFCPTGDNRPYLLMRNWGKLKQDVKHTGSFYLSKITLDATSSGSCSCTIKIYDHTSSLLGSVTQDTAGWQTGLAYPKFVFSPPLLVNGDFYFELTKSDSGPSIPHFPTQFGCSDADITSCDNEDYSDASGIYFGGGFLLYQDYMFYYGEDEVTECHPAMPAATSAIGGCGCIGYRVDGYGSLAERIIPKDCSGKEYLRVAVKSSIAGNPINFKYGINDYDEHTAPDSEMAINQPDVWEMKTIDLTGLSEDDKAGLQYWSISAGKDAVDSSTGRSKPVTVFIDMLGAGGSFTKPPPQQTYTAKFQVSPCKSPPFMLLIQGFGHGTVQ